ncbi:MAG TPA: peptidylprolyl isomerase [Usitatibacter sp.]|nr:peptidylprolyl isomerase [Usitatibacter sp.]
MHRTLAASAAFALCAPAAFAQSVGPVCDAALRGSAPQVKLTTTMGPIVVELNKDKAPISTENFIKYVDSGHYNGTLFHRVIDGFMIQGGGLDKGMQEKATRSPILNESTNGLKNDAYTIAMARTQVRNSATSQFYINVKDNDSLNFVNDFNPGYAVFGKVIEGKDTVDKIRKVPTGNVGPFQNVPKEPVVIEKAECLAPAAAGAAKGAK